MPLTIITGANRGIGLELARQLKARGADIVAVCRKSSPELDQLGVRVETGIDVAQPKDVATLKDRLAGASIGLLINNAGILQREKLGQIDYASIEQQLEVNALGPLRITEALAPLFAPDAKVVIITSRMGSIADNGSGGYYGYRMSKAAVNAAGVSLARDLSKRGVSVALIHPGMVNTDMTGHGITPEESVRGVLARIDQLSPANTGHFWHAATGEELPW